MSTDEKQRCVFCEISAGKDEKTELLHSDETMVVFRDIKPASPHHYLVVPKQHIPDPKILGNSHVELVERMVSVGKEVLQKQNADLNDIRMGFHWPPFHAIRHLHLHVISSTSQMGWIARGIFKENSFWFVTVDWLLQRLKKMQNTPKESEL